MNPAVAALEARAIQPRAVYLACADEPAFAFVHPPAGQRARAPAVLLCDTFGCDRMLLHLTYRHLALRLSALGFWVMRVDYPGTCDAGGEPRSAGQWETYKDALHRAADALRGWSGADELVLFGALLGGSLAAVVASERKDVGGLVAWAPAVNGREFLREQLALTALQQRRMRESEPEAAEREPEALGFLVTRELSEALRGLRLGELTFGRPSRACILPRSSSSGEGALIVALQRSGSTVCVHPAPLYPYEALSEPDARLPEPLLEHVVEWMQASFPERDRPIRTLALDGEGARESLVQSLPSGAHVRETPVRFGSAPQMFGIVAEPLVVDMVASELPGIVLVNGGNNHRVGINRNATEWARSWAALGFRTLRFDIRGLGDSPPARAHGLNTLYREETRGDLREALDFLGTSCALRRFVLMGLCAGGYQAMHHALSDERVVDVVILNPLRLRRIPTFQSAWKQCFPPGDRLAALRDTIHRQRLADVSRGVLGLIGRGIVRPHRHDVSSAFVRLVERGARALVVFQSGEPMHGWLEQVLHHDRRRLEADGRFRIATLPASDHIFSPLRSQVALTRLLTDHLGEYVPAEVASVTE